MSAGFGRVRLTTTDLDLWCQVELKAETPRPGKALMPVRSLATVLKNMPHSRVELRSVGDDVVCQAGSAEVRLSGLDIEEYPDVEEPQGCVLSMPLTAALVDKVAYAVSKDETRYTLTGVLLRVEDRQLKLVATDGHRLARFVGSLPPGSDYEAGGEPVEAIVPVRLLNEAGRLGGKLGGSVLFELHEKAAAVRINGSIRIWSKLIEGRYPGLRGNHSFGIHGYGIGAEGRPVQRRGAGGGPSRRVAGIRAWCCRSRIPVWCFALARMPATALPRSRGFRRPGSRERCRSAVCGSATCRTRLRVCPACRGCSSGFPTTRAVARWRFRARRRPAPDC